MHLLHQSLLQALHRVQTPRKIVRYRSQYHWGLLKPKVIGTVILDLEYDMGKIHDLNLKQVYYFPGAPKLLVSPQKWAQDRGEYKVGREGTYLKVMGKLSILVWNNRKLKRTIPHAPGCAFP